MPLNRSFRECIGKVGIWISERMVKWRFCKFRAVAIDFVNILGSVDAVSVRGEANDRACISSVVSTLEGSIMLAICFV